MKIHRFNLVIWLLICLFLSGCRQNKSDRASDITVIDVVSQLGKYEAIPVSRFVTELEYIPLETNDNCLIGTVEELRGLVVTPTHIFIACNSPSSCYVFGRDGKFIRKIGSVGQGPGEFTHLTGLSIDEKNRMAYIETVWTVLEYSWDGVFRQSITKPNSMSDTPLDAVYFVHDSLFIGHILNFAGNENYNFCLFDKSGRVVKSFDNHIKLNRTRLRYTDVDAAMTPYRLSENIYVKEIATDTLYCLNKQNELVPQFVFDVGKYAVKKEKRGDKVDTKDFELNGTITIPSRTMPLVGIPDYLFFYISPFFAPALYDQLPKGRTRTSSVFGNIIEGEDRRVPGIYDIVHHQTQLLDTDLVSKKWGLINDLDGGLSFWPRYYTSDNELVAIWQPYEMKEILTEEYFAAHQINDPQAHQKLKELLKTLREDDNSVIVIGKLK
jgi:hypothetical protein